MKQSLNASTSKRPLVNMIMATAMAVGFFLTLLQLPVSTVAAPTILEKKHAEEQEQEVEIAVVRNPKLALLLTQRKANPSSFSKRMEVQQHEQQQYEEEEEEPFSLAQSSRSLQTSLTCSDLRNRRSLKQTGEAPPENQASRRAAAAKATATSRRNIHKRRRSLVEVPQEEAQEEPTDRELFHTSFSRYPRSPYNNRYSYAGKKDNDYDYDYDSGYRSGYRSSSYRYGKKSSKKDAGRYYAPRSPRRSPFTIGRVLDRLGNFHILLEALDVTGLLDVVTDRSLLSPDLTLFAPTDAAFLRLGRDTINDLLDNPDILRDILLYHVLDCEVTVPDLLELETSPITVETALAGETLELDVPFVSDRIQSIFGWQRGERPRYWDYTIDVLGSGNDGEEAEVDRPNILAQNGVIHVIDRVLLPSLAGTDPTPVPAPVAASP